MIVWRLFQIRDRLLFGNRNGVKQFASHSFQKSSFPAPILKTWTPTPAPSWTVVPPPVLYIRTRLHLSDRLFVLAKVLVKFKVHGRTWEWLWLDDPSNGVQQSIEKLEAVSVIFVVLVVIVVVVLVTFGWIRNLGAIFVQQVTQLPTFDTVG